MFGPDSKASVTIGEIKQMVQAIRDLEVDFRTPLSKELTDELMRIKAIFGKSLAINQDIRAGEIITFNVLEAKKPKGYGIDSELFNDVLGKRVKHDMKSNSFLTTGDLD